MTRSYMLPGYTIDKNRLAVSGKDEGLVDSKQIDESQDECGMKPNRVDSSEQPKTVPVSIAAILDELLPASKSMRTKKKTGKLVMCNCFVHWVRIKPENISGLVEGKRITKGLRCIACIIVNLDYEKPHVLGCKVEDLNHDDWVRIFAQLGVFEDVPGQLGLNEKSAADVTWESSPGKYFYRNVFVLRHWNIIRFKEDNEHLKMKVLSLNELVKAAEEKAATKTE